MTLEDLGGAVGTAGPLAVLEEAHGDPPQAQVEGAGA